MADAPDKGDLVRLESHPGPTAVTQAATRQFVGDVFRLYRKAGREACDRDDHGPTVRFTGGEIAQHARTLPDGYSPSGAAELTRKPGTAAEDL